MERALTMAGKDDRPVAGLRNEAVEGRGNVAIGKIERRRRVTAVEQERAIGRLAVARRPHLTDAVERAGLALDEQVGAELGVAAGLKRRVPAVGQQIRRRVNIE